MAHMSRVCSSCFDDSDLRAWIRGNGGPRGCDGCGRFDSPTVGLFELCFHIRECLRKYWGLAADQLPYESREGGYQGATWDTYDLLVDEAGLALPRDRGDRLLLELTSTVGDDVWCEYDWLSLDHDVSLRFSWDRFCKTVMHERRFFFHHSSEVEDRDSYSPTELLESIARMSERIGLVVEIPDGVRLWRARTDLAHGHKCQPSDFGPPPANRALQSNRMNPPGIPMLYLASTAVCALKEARVKRGHVGRWRVRRPLRVLDLRSLPRVPGIFSEASRHERLTIRFLHAFTSDIMRPVERDERIHVDYLPSQVVTEYVRDFVFSEGKLDGIAYGSTVSERGWNVVLFANSVNIGVEERQWYESPEPQWLDFVGAQLRSI